MNISKYNKTVILNVLVEKGSSGSSCLCIWCGDVCAYPCAWYVCVPLGCVCVCVCVYMLLFSENFVDTVVDLMLDIIILSHESLT